MSEVAVSMLSEAEARSLTDEVKHDAERLWRKLVELYDGLAHLALGYSSWAGYFAAEFGGSDATAYRLLQSGRVMDELPIGSRKPTNEAQARELTPLLDEPEQLREAWAEVVELHPEPTAADVREVVTRFTGYSSATAEWSTPQDLFDELQREFPFVLDVCASDVNAKCATYFTRTEDGLAQPWSGICFMNPPYGSEIGPWVKKAWESGKLGAVVVCLVPARTDTAWWWDYCIRGEIRFLRGRLKFGGATSGAPFPSALVVFPSKPKVIWWERAS